YFEPLRRLKLRGDTRLSLGLVHFSDGVPGTRKRLATAEKYVGDFLIATECGFGRYPPEAVSKVLAGPARPAKRGWHAAPSRPSRPRISAGAPGSRPRGRNVLGLDERRQHCLRAHARVGAAVGVEAGARRGINQLPPQFSILGLQASDRRPHVMSVETGQRLLDCRLLWTTHARNPALGARVGERLEGPLNDDVLPTGPRLAGVGKLDVIELSSDKSAFSGINRRMLRAHRRHPVVDGSTPIFPGSDARRFVLQPHGNILRGLKKWAAS